MSEVELLARIEALQSEMDDLRNSLESGDDTGPQGSRGLAPDWFDAADSGGGLDLSKAALGYKCNPAGDDPDLVRIYAGEIGRIAVEQRDITVADGGYIYVRRTIANDAMLVATAASVPANDATYLYYRLYKFAVTDGVASLITAFRPFDIETSSGGFTRTVTVITSMQYASNSLQYRTKLLTYTNGMLSSVGAESGWNTLFTAVTGCPV